MSLGTEEVGTTCPYCGEPISIIVESLYSGQSYIEDCEVCCRPIRFFINADEDERISITAEREGQ